MGSVENRLEPKTEPPMGNLARPNPWNPCSIFSYYFRILAILVQIIAVVINTALVDELVALMDDNIPLAKVTLVQFSLCH